MSTSACLRRAAAGRSCGIPLEPEVQPLDEWFRDGGAAPDEAPQREAAMQAHLDGLTPAYRRRVARAPSRQPVPLGARARHVRARWGRQAAAHGRVGVGHRRPQARRGIAARLRGTIFALAVAGSDDGVWDWDLLSGMAFESARAREIAGLPPDPEVQAAGRHWVDSLRVHPDDAPAARRWACAHLAGETPAYECEYRVRRDDGTYPVDPRARAVPAAMPTASRTAWPAR